MVKKSCPVSFRLPTHYMAIVTAKGKELGLSPGEFARKVVVESLNDDIRSRTIDELARILREIQSGRDDLATVAKALMVTAGGQTPEDADAWVHENLH